MILSVMKGMWRFILETDALSTLQTLVPIRKEGLRRNGDIPNDFSDKKILVDGNDYFEKTACTYKFHMIYCDSRKKTRMW